MKESANALAQTRIREDHHHSLGCVRTTGRKPVRSPYPDSHEIRRHAAPPPRAKIELYRILQQKGKF